MHIRDYRVVKVRLQATFGQAGRNMQGGAAVDGGAQDVPRRREFSERFLDLCLEFLI